jgi:hypothetical protein
LDQLVSKAIEVSQADRERKDHKALLAQLDLLDHAANRVKEAPKEPQDRLDNQAKVGHRDHVVREDHLDQPELPESLENLDKGVNPAVLALKVHWKYTHIEIIL